MMDRRRLFLIVLAVLLVALIVKALGLREGDLDAPPAAVPVELLEAGHRDVSTDEVEGPLVPIAVAPVEPQNSRVVVPKERWTLHFELEKAYAAEDAPAVEAPVTVLVEGPSRRLQRTLTGRDDSGRFLLEVALTRAALRASTVYLALDPAALDARVGTALRMDGLSDRVRLGKCLPSDGVWDSEEQTVDLGTVGLWGPLVVGGLSLGRHEFADLNVTVQFYSRVLAPSELDVALGDPFTGGAVVKPVHGSEFGRVSFSLTGKESRVFFGTFGEPRAWRVDATSPNLPSAGRRGWWQLAEVGQLLQLPAAEWLTLKLSIDLARLPDAGLVLFREYAEPKVFELSAVELKRRSQSVALSETTVPIRAAGTPSLMSIGTVSLGPTQRHALEVWSHPDASGRVRLLHTQGVASGAGHRQLIIQ